MSDLSRQSRADLRRFAAVYGAHAHTCERGPDGLGKCTCGLDMLRLAVPALLAELEKAENFKTFVHAYLDSHGVPSGDPENEHQKQGCRIGARLDLLFAQRDEARTWVRRITNEARILTCAFCGQEYPPNTPPANDDSLTAHVKVCPKHPMREVERERDAALAKYKALQEGVLKIVAKLRE